MARTPRSPRTPPSPEDLAERALVARVQAGDREALDELLGQYQRRLYGVCVRMVTDRVWATDLTQDAMVKIIQGLDSYDGRSRLSTWMIRVTMNVCISAMRSEKLRRHASLDAGSADNPNKPRSDSIPHKQEHTGDSNVEHDEQRALVRQALDRIDPQQRAILILRDVNGLDYEQIGDVLGVPVGTVKSRLFRARAALRTACEQPPEADDEEATEPDDPTPPRPTTTQR